MRKRFDDSLHDAKCICVQAFLDVSVALYSWSIYLLLYLAIWKMIGSIFMPRMRRRHMIDRASHKRPKRLVPHPDEQSDPTGNFDALIS